MLKLIGALTLLIIVLGLLTGAINAVVLWETVKGIVMVIIEQVTALIQRG